MDQKYLRILGISSLFGHIGIGMGMIFSLGTVAISPAWGVLSTVFPYLVFPILFLICGALAGLGVCDKKYLSFSFYIGAGIMFSWAAASIVAWITLGIPVPSAIWLAYIGILKLTLAHSIARKEKLAQAIQDAKAIALNGQ